MYVHSGITKLKREFFKNQKNSRKYNKKNKINILWIQHFVNQKEVQNLSNKNRIGVSFNYRVFYNKSDNLKNKTGDF